MNKKSKMVKKIAKEMGLKVKTLKLSKIQTNDLIGVPSNKNNKKDQSSKEKNPSISANDLLNKFENDLNSGLFGNTKEDIMKSIAKKVKKIVRG